MFNLIGLVNTYSECVGLILVGTEVLNDCRMDLTRMKSERVRSKSEKIIADELHMKHIPYKYEMPIQLENRGKTIQIYPDFTALNKRTGKKWIIEHLGMINKEE